jgi:RND family efflux transporter MFP subunit
MKKTIVIIVAIGLIVLMFFRLKSNHEKINASKNISTDLGYVNVTVSKVQQMEFTPELNLVGNLNPFTELDIAAEAQGTISSLNAELGQQKTKGSTIGTIDNKLKLLAVNSAKISVDKSGKTLERYRNLFAGGTATAQQLDDAQNSYDNAVIQLEQTEEQLSDATIKCPINGIITKKYVENGAFVNIGSSIVSIIDISKLKIKLNVSEGNVYQLKTGDNSIITTSVHPAIEFSGNISYISPKGDDSHNYQVEIVIPNTSEHPLKAGTFVNVKIKLPFKGTGLYFPREALQGSISNAQVFVASEGKAVLRNIGVNSGNDKYIEVISGLKEGDEVITSGMVNLSDGVAIKVVQND